MYPFLRHVIHCVAFSTQTKMGNHHHYSIPEYFKPLPKKYPTITSSDSSRSLSLSISVCLCVCLSPPSHPSSKIKGKQAKQPAMGL